MIRLDASRATPFLDPDHLRQSRERAAACHGALLTRSGAGSEFLGWRDLLLDSRPDLLQELTTTAAYVRSRADVLLCIGIGGSYLGAEAVIGALSPWPGASDLQVHFIGQHLGSAYTLALLSHLEGKSVFVNVISKSGTTLEPAVAFRLVRNWLSERFSDADDRIIVTTDPIKGALNDLRGRYGYRKFEIPPDVGGRFSVLTPVGLLPIACAGVDARELFDGAAEAADELTSTDSNPALEYAAVRNALYDEGYAVEILAAFEPRLAGLQAWWQQLFGESEGKDGEGLYPDSVAYSSDLHSVGQYVQDGQRILIESFLMVEEDDSRVIVPESDENADGLNYLAGKSLHEINTKAYEASAEAHGDGGVPNMTIWTERISAPSIGELLYFFEHAVAISGYLLGVNPFDQPGVEAYKRNMFRLLGRD